MDTEQQPEPSTERTPEAIGNFLVREQIAEEALATVYAAEHRQLDRRVALQLLRPELVGSPEPISRFLAEAKVTSRVASAHAPEVLDMGELPDGRHYHVMERIAGRLLAEVLDGGARLSLERALHITRGIADALHAAHGRGIIHRDLRAQKIVLIHEDGDADFVKVLGFGAAPPSDLADFLYLSPEQCLGADPQLDVRTDVYALGVLVHQMLAGQMPFAAYNVAQLLLVQMTRAPLALRSIDSAIPEHVEAAVYKALSKDPVNRFATVRDFVQALDHVTEEPWFAPPTVGTEQAPEDDKYSRVSSRRSPTLIVALGLVGVALLLFSVLLIRGRSSAQSAAIAIAPPSAPSMAPPAVVLAPPIAKDTPAKALTVASARPIKHVERSAERPARRAEKSRDAAQLLAYPE